MTPEDPVGPAISPNPLLAALDPLYLNLRLRKSRFIHESLYIMLRWV